jgi:hypothetical protein
MATIKIRKGAVMVEEKDFFSANHNRLLDLAIWAKYLAWGALVYAVFSVGMEVIKYMLALVQIQHYTDFSLLIGDFLVALRNQPSYLFALIAQMATAFVNGIIYYVVLKGISLGLNMILETDINYREKKEKGGAQ